MRSLAVLILVAAGLAIPAENAKAQTTTNTQGDSIVFTLQLTEADLAMLRNGQSLTSKIPVEIRNRVSEVKLSYKPTGQTASLNNGIPSTTTPPNTGFNSGSTGLPGVGQGTGNRTDSISNPGTSTLPPAGSSIPRFTPPSSTGTSTNNGMNSALVPPSSLAPVNSGSQYQSPLGPPISSAPTTSNNSGFQPPASTNPSNSFRSTNPPITLPPSTNNTFPVVPNQSQIRNSAPPTGTEFDTTATLPPNTNTGWKLSETAGRKTPAAPNRLAARDVNNGSTWQSPAAQAPGSWQPPQSTNNQFAGMNPPGSQTGIPGHNIPAVGAQPPYLAQRQGNTANSSTHNQGIAPASIPGQNNNQSQVGAHDGNHGPTANTPIAQLNRFNNFMYFLLLCSIGLNIYLGWISRGFYTRYRELADELRDTFSTAI